MTRPGPVCFRPDSELRQWLTDEAERTGQNVSEILATAVRELRDRRAVPVLRDSGAR